MNYKIYKSFIESEEEIIVEGNLFLANCKNLKSLGNLIEVFGGLDLSFSSLNSLGKLKYVGNNLFLKYSEIRDLGNLIEVGGNLDLTNCKITSLGKLTTIGLSLHLNNNIIELGNLKKANDIYGFKGDQSKYPHLRFAN